ncbi:sensor histidine kinase [Rathayibacter soli]|uniref:sensor histidine kinase n=1 Tax=Rathayibacter soli TaxID=3144168 RepID=UPI0027E5A3BC|nr:histidine kinase [Glaciibacter superstes]
MASIRNRNTRGWYRGAGFGLIYQVVMIISIWSSPNAYGLTQQVIATVLLVPFYIGFIFLPPMGWGEQRRIRVAILAVYWLYTGLYFPLIGADALWLWILVGAVAATLCEELVLFIPIITVLVAVPLLYGFVTDFADSTAIAAPIIFSVAVMMFGINEQIKAMRELKQAQGEVARLAVVEERARFSRDMHDVLGHSLTVVTVKSELARRLVSIDPARAEAEIADIERLSRAALTDLRAAVAGYREMTLTTELGAAQAALAAADIQAHLPANPDSVAAEVRELFGWVLREAVTNVVRHSDARNCWVQVTRTELTVDDDGHGMADATMPAMRSGSVLAGGAFTDAPGGDAVAGDAFVSGVGLLGLRERAEKADADLTVTASDHGGVRVAVRRRA